jgi:integrase
MGSSKTKEQQYKAALNGLWDMVKAEEVAQADAERIEQLCSAFDEEDARESLPTDMYEGRRVKHVKPGTRRTWVTRLRHVARDTTLTEASANDINSTTTGWVKSEDGPKKITVRNRENALKKFYRYHTDLPVEPGEIVVHQPDDKNGWSERDLLTAEERAALRAVCDHPRDRAIYHLAIYCGMRNNALRTLRVKDIDLEEHEWYFNTEADGLKDIHKPDAPRPLFQAERAVRDWLDVHPDPQPENPLIVAKPSSRKNDYTDTLARSSIGDVLERLKKRTACPRCRGDGTVRSGECPRCDGTGDSDDVETIHKPCHPHMMRHNFVTMCRKHPDITDADIKFYIGHAPDSSVMESTYSHLSSEDHNTRGHAAMGTTDAAAGGDETPPWDETCDSCDMVLAPGESVCSGCGTERGATPWDTPEPDNDLTGTEGAIELLNAVNNISQAVGEDRETMLKLLNNPESEEAQRLLHIWAGDVDLDADEQTIAIGDADD